MKANEIMTVDCLRGFEENQVEEIIDEINWLTQEQLKRLYCTTTEALRICTENCAELPTATIDHFSAIHMVLAQEIAKRYIETGAQ